MRRFVIVLLLITVASLAIVPPGSAKSAKKGRLLMMTLTMGFRHPSLELSEQIVKEIGEKSGLYESTVTKDVAAFTPENLKNYDVVLFNTTGEIPFTDQQKKDFVDFVRGGKGFVGVHSATDTLYMWPEYNTMIGGYFDGHPWHQMVKIEVLDPSSPIVGFLGKSFEINDEIYQISDFQYKDSRVLLRLDPTSVNLKARGARPRHYGWPVSWTRRYGKGRVYYNSLGHDEVVWKDQRYQQMLQIGIQWAMRRK